MNPRLLLPRLQRRLDRLPGQTRSTLVLWAGAALVGVVAVALARASEGVFHGFQALTRQWFWWPLLSLPLGGMLIRWVMQRIGQGAEGSGIPQALAALEQAQTPLAARLLSGRIALAKFVGIVMGVGSGFVLGREGPTVQIGAALMYACRRFVPDDVDFSRHLILAGGAAGIAAAFNTPLAGIVFAFEELAHSVEHSTSGRTIGAVILAGIISLALLGNYTYFGHIRVPSFNIAILLPMTLVAIGGGLIGGLFSWLCVHQARWLPTALSRWRQRHPYLFVAGA